jgi:FdhD protein
MQPDQGSQRFSFSVLSPTNAATQEIARSVIVEAPIAFEFNGIGYAVMMATPNDLDDFATGFSLSEKLIDHPNQILAVDTHRAKMGWIMRIQLPLELTERLATRARQRVSESSCGLCGMDNLEEVMRPLPHVAARLSVSDAAIFSALKSLRTQQPLNAATGSAHAAAFCAPDGSILMTREDVGRHNALDKLIGALAKAQIDASTGFLLLTARCSFELVQKAILANCPLLVTISAATDLAINTSAQYGLRLISLARHDGALAAMHQID